MADPAPSEDALRLADAFEEADHAVMMMPDAASVEELHRVNITGDDHNLIVTALRAYVAPKAPAPSEDALPCPFCGTKPETFPKQPSSEGNAWGAVRCVNKQCATYDDSRQGGVRVEDGQDVSDERGSQEYINCAIRRWNKRHAS